MNHVMTEHQKKKIKKTQRLEDAVTKITKIMSPHKKK